MPTISDLPNELLITIVRNIYDFSYEIERSALTIYDWRSMAAKENAYRYRRCIQVSSRGKTRFMATESYVEYG